MKSTCGSKVLSGPNSVSIVESLQTKYPIFNDRAVNRFLRIRSNAGSYRPRRYSAQRRALVGDAYNAIIVARGGHENWGGGHMGRGGRRQPLGRLSSYYLSEYGNTGTKHPRMRLVWIKGDTMRHVKPQPIRNKIDLADPNQIRILRRRLGISADDLQRVVAKVGNSIAE